MAPVPMAANSHRQIQMLLPVVKDCLMQGSGGTPPREHARLIILAAGGTIATTTDAPEARGVPDLRAADLASALPQLLDLAAIETRDVLAKPSASMTLTDIAAISSAVSEAAKRAMGVVITQGSDTLEETAFALSLLVQSETPIVLTAAMRKEGSPGADGPANLLAACRVACAPGARGKGILVVADDEIHAGPLVRKSHSFRTHAFSSLPFGPLGYVAEERVRFALAPAERPPLLSCGTGTPVVPILEAGPGLEPQTLEAFVRAAIDGLIVSLPGAGHVAAHAAPALAALALLMPVVFASRTGAGEVLRATYAYPGGEIDLINRGLIPAGRLDARKARIALQILLSAKASRGEIAAFFSKF